MKCFQNEIKKAVATKTKRLPETNGRKTGTFSKLSAKDRKKNQNWDEFMNLEKKSRKRTTRQKIQKRKVAGIVIRLKKRQFHNFQHFSIFRKNSNLIDDSLSIRQIQLVFPRKRCKHRRFLKQKPGAKPWKSIISIERNRNREKQDGKSQYESFGLTKDLSATQVEVRNAALIQNIINKKRKNNGRIERKRARSQVNLGRVKSRWMGMCEGADDTRRVDQLREALPESKLHSKLCRSKSSVLEFLKNFEMVESVGKEEKCTDIMNESIKQSVLFGANTKNSRDCHKKKWNEAAKVEITSQAQSKLKSTREPDQTKGHSKSKPDSAEESANNAQKIEINKNKKGQFEEKRLSISNEAVTENLKNMNECEKEEKGGFKSIEKKKLDGDASTSLEKSMHTNSKFFIQNSIRAKEKNTKQQEKVKQSKKDFSKIKNSKNQSKVLSKNVSISLFAKKLDKSLKLNASIEDFEELQPNSVVKPVKKQRRTAQPSQKPSTRSCVFKKAAESLSPAPKGSFRQWTKYKSITSILSRKFKVTDLTAKVRYLRRTVSAASFILYDLTSGKTLLRAGQADRREIASLTKIATFWTVHEFMGSNQLDLSTTLFEVSGEAAAVIGTSAKLVKGGFMSVRDLLYGLMLPSGNDAALCLAENIGRLVRIASGANLDPRILGSSETAYPDWYLFVDLMNEQRKLLNLKCSFFMNPHGLNNPKNFSTCEDLLLLCRKALELDLFRTIVQCKNHRGNHFSRRLSTTPQKTSFTDLRQIDISSTRSSRNQTPDNQFSGVKKRAHHLKPKSTRTSLEKLVKFRRSNTKVQQSCGELGTESKQVSFRDNIELIGDAHSPDAPSAFYFSKKSVKSILKSDNPPNSQQKDVQSLYDKGQYLVNRRKTPAKDSLYDKGQMKSKRQFYNQMRGVFIKKIRKSETNPHRLSSQLRTILEARKAQKQSNKQTDQSRRQDAASNRVSGKGGKQKGVKRPFREKQSGNLRLTNHKTTKKSFNLSSRISQNVSKKSLKISRNGRGFASLNCSLEKSQRPKQQSGCLFKSREKSTLNKPHHSKESARLRNKSSKSCDKTTKINLKSQKAKLSKCKSIAEIHKMLIQKSVFAFDKEQKQTRSWSNTNMLLTKNRFYKGIKTGITSNAKGCLASLHCVNDREFVTSKFEWIYFVIFSCFAIKYKSKTFFRYREAGQLCQKPP